MPLSHARRSCFIASSNSDVAPAKLSGFLVGPAIVSSCPLAPEPIAGTLYMCRKYNRMDATDGQERVPVVDLPPLHRRNTCNEATKPKDFDFSIPSVVDRVTCEYSQTVQGHQCWWLRRRENYLQTQLACPQQGQQHPRRTIMRGHCTWRATHIRILSRIGSGGKTADNGSFIGLTDERARGPALL